MNKNAAIIFGTILFISLAKAIPSENILISPDSLTLLRNDKLQINYSLPCESSELPVVATFSNDDTGDLVAAVGIIYSADPRNCTPLAKGTKPFTMTVNPKRFGYDSNNGVGFAPMKLK